MRFSSSCFLAVLMFLSGCSPFYIMRAGYEEASILLKRKPIAKLIESPKTEPELKEKFKLVLQARDYAESLELNAKESFTQYSSIDRDVLVWVLSATPKDSLEPYTWWFPVVGRVPYKGFFDKADGVKEAEKLKAKGYDIFLRPSPAFSTLGWFNDPLLSTMIKFDEVSLVDTVIHEILHNTVWIRNDVPFNETLANIVGVLGSKEFFIKNEGPASVRALEGANTLADELRFAQFLAKLHQSLVELYAKRGELPKEELLKQRQEIFDAAKSRWEQSGSELKTDRYRKLGSILNNAVIIAHRIYLTDPERIMALYSACGESLPKFITEIKQLGVRVKESDQPLPELLEAQIKGVSSQNLP